MTQEQPMPQNAISAQQQISVRVNRMKRAPAINIASRSFSKRRKSGLELSPKGLQFKEIADGTQRALAQSVDRKKDFKNREIGS